MNSYVHKCLKNDIAINSTRRIRRIIDAKYKKANLKTVMAKQCQKTSSEESYILLNLLRKFEDLFDGTLGTQNTTMVYSELKDDAKSVCLKPYTVLRVHEEMFRKEAERLLSLGVLEEENESKWEALYFSQTKTKTNSVILLSDFRNLNMQLKLKPYPIPKIREMLLKIEVFQYDTSLELNMGYYHITLS